MMRPALLLAAALLVSCATPYAKVKEAKSIEEARGLLGDYKPNIVPYPPNAEAWYFGNEECVLFVDGKVFGAMSAADLPDRHWRKHDNLICSPSELNDPVLKPRP